MKIFLFDNYKAEIQLISVLIFFGCMAFIDRTRAISYTALEILAAYNIFSRVGKNIAYDKFFLHYGLIVVWAVIVTLLSPVAHTSFIALRYWLLPIVIFASLYDFDILHAIRRYLWIPSITLLFANIVLFIYWSGGEQLLTTNKIYAFCYYIIGGWTSKIYTSTVVLCLIIFIWCYFESSKYKNLLLIINLVSGLLSYDRMFWFSLAIIMVAYLFVEKYKLSAKKIFGMLFTMIASIIIIALILNYLGMDLHYKERFATYEYWFSVAHVSPVYGIGVGRDSLYYFYNTHYPVPSNIFLRNPFTPYTSHNFFLDLLLTQGFIGLSIYLFVLFQINSYSIKFASNVKYKYVTFYISLAVYSKFLVDNQLDNRKILIFWFFIITSYLISTNYNKLNNNSYLNLNYEKK